jgi:hypothetical protein
LTCSKRQRIGLFIGLAKKQVARFRANARRWGV